MIYPILSFTIICNEYITSNQTSEDIKKILSKHEITSEDLKLSLFYAIDSNNFDLAEFVLNRGADPNGCHAKIKFTPLEMCINLYFNLKITTLLFQRGAVFTPEAQRLVLNHRRIDLKKAKEIDKLLQNYLKNKVKIHDTNNKS